ncbi:hypothetical protein AAW01_01860 [Aurantiacibacter gangjinensis]|uniref:Uncharacterized protein n=2 Tax=Aurantiacibacter gangjinensis TaxID=502682 RepID=A0A0G9MWF7_9SPHN|nr:hypothetical protein AAW01_01860 [Aurantiacibacter gangjinensis]
MQRHHLLPLQLLRNHALGRMIETIGRERIGIDDFRRNGLLLPATEASAFRTAPPLHRGPHRAYNALVSQRAGQIEADFKRERRKSLDRAASHAIMRLALLQSALRRRLLVSARNRLFLSRKDPFRSELDFAELDAMAEQLWAATAPGD